MNNLRKSYIIALSLIALATIFSQILIQNFLGNREKDARLINIAGRQRMLSQKITKHALILSSAKNAIEFDHQQQLLENALVLWRKSHNGLLNGDKGLGLPSLKEDERLFPLFDSLRSHYSVINKTAHRFTGYEYDNMPKYTGINSIIRRESLYLYFMNRIVFKIEEIVNIKLQRLRLVEAILMFLTLGLLTAEVILIFRPTVKKIESFIEELNYKNQELEVAETEIRQSLEESKSIQEKLEYKNYELEVAEEEVRQSLEESNTMRDQLELALVQVKDKNKIIEQKNSNINASIQYAKRLQSSVLQSEKLIRQLLPNSFIFYKPKDIVSGDFYWVSAVQGAIVLVAADCTGHGIPGAFISKIGVMLLDLVVNHSKVISPSKILHEVDGGIRRTFHQAETQNNDGMDIAICVIDEAKKILTYAGARNPLVYIQENTLKVIKADKFSLGGNQRKITKTFTNHVIDISTPTSFYIFSDGFQDQFGGTENRKYYPGNLRVFLHKNNCLSFEEQKRELDKELKGWMSHSQTEQTDDILVIGAKV